MLKTISAYTTEGDEFEYALSDLLEQIKPSENLLSNTIGLLTFYEGFQANHFISKLCNALPFDVIGCSTCANTTGKVVEPMSIILTVLTSDDVYFSAFSADIRDTDAFKAKYQKALSNLNGCAPVMAFTYMPVYDGIFGNSVTIASDIMNNLPLFGTCAITRDSLLKGFVSHNGLVSKSLCAFALIAGNVSPKFLYYSTPDESLQSFDACVSKSEGFLVKQINNMSARDYMLSIGFKLDPDDHNSIVEYKHTIVRIISQKSEYALGIIAFTPEGYMVFAKHIPEGSIISLTTVDEKGVLDTAKKMINVITSDPDKTAICFSCLIRRITLTDAFAEIDVVTKNAKNSNYQFSYAGGEICPVCDENNNLVNHYHNITIIACII
ncbi:MAG: FIST C-terminal domain-containing protein [Christensenellaceae bacterium]|jgi:hypothetical protein|nr:FIST C-terminal domain-containing protein [Christensenellaceae bacterium]